ncbi:hypothetical protein AVE30378_02135 [Achromobacter veterisilvae]|uniref:Uncharacterized protein n=1 Tax=Achromobacter veterisilvae TaxID=2069367 RepID=A0A446CFC9_9BURK|nr:hypothetical protein AVE30378_02135 [Achromobacter veterisilvae]
MRGPSRHCNSTRFKGTVTVNSPGLAGLERRGWWRAPETPVASQTPTRSLPIRSLTEFLEHRALPSKPDRKTPHTFRGCMPSLTMPLQMQGRSAADRPTPCKSSPEPCNLGRFLRLLARLRRRRAPTCCNREAALVAARSWQQTRARQTWILSRSTPAAWHARRRKPAGRTPRITLGSTHSLGVNSGVIRDVEAARFIRNSRRAVNSIIDKRLCTFIERRVATVCPGATDVWATRRILAPTKAHAEPLQRIRLPATHSSCICSGKDAKHGCAGGKRCSGRASP